MGASTLKNRDESTRQGFQALTVCWYEDGPMPRCLLVYRFDSAKVAQRVTAAVEDIVHAMGIDWRMV